MSESKDLVQARRERRKAKAAEWTEELSESNFHLNQAKALRDCK